MSYYFSISFEEKLTKKQLKKEWEKNTLTFYLQQSLYAPLLKIKRYQSTNFLN